MSIHKKFIAVATFGMIASCASAAPYYYDPYYGYYPVAYDDYYYDAAAVSSYYYYPDMYYYSASLATVRVDAVPPAVRLQLARWGAEIDPGCVSAVTSGDNDNDGIDSNATITFRCNTTSSGQTSEVAGIVTLRDLDDSVAGTGYELGYGGLSVRIVSPIGVLTSRQISGTTIVQKVAGESQQLVVTRDTVVNATDTFPDAVQRQSTLTMKGQSTFTPEIVAGSPITRGTMTLSGQGIYTGPDGVAVTLTRQTDPSLHWNNDCSKEANSRGYDAGAIVFRSSRGYETRIVHESCTAVSVTNRPIPAQ